MDNALMRHRRMQETKRAFADQFDRPTPQDYPVTERSSLLPLATYANGQTGLAWPGMIAEDIPNALTAPSRSTQGGISYYDTVIPQRDAQGNEYISDMSPITPGNAIPEGLNFAGTAAVGGSVVPKPTNAAGMFGGRLARTADQTALAKAEELAAKGTPREDIWNQTGWFQGVDGKWRFEIDDSGATLPYNEIGKEYRGPIKDLLSHPDLFHAEPHVGQSNGRLALHEQYTSGTGLATKDGRISVSAPNADEALRTMLHELQHQVQYKHGFSVGSAGFWDRDAYLKNAGENEARAVEKRMHLTPDERRARPPWLDYDVPEADQIVRFNTLGANSRNSTLPGTILSEASDQAPRVANPIKAYHGSPHDFDKFDISKIGTGEGAQAFGHGLYFAENEGVAKSYRNMDAPYRGVKGFKGISDADNRLIRSEAESVHHGSSTIDDAIAMWKSAVERRSQAGESVDARNAQQRVDALIRAKNAGGEVDADAGTGKMYEVNIHADPNDFLDWDKPLSQQSEKVRGALESTDRYMAQPEYLRYAGADMWPTEAAARSIAEMKGNSEARIVPRKQWNGQQGYSVVLDTPIGENIRKQVQDKDIANQLREAGIPGIRYLDQGSRASGDGSRNLVVFDDALIEILRKYGLLGTLGAGAAASSFGAPPAEAAPVNALMRR